jgi:hypothetical protein
MRQLRSLGIDPGRWNPVSHRSVFLRAARARRSPGGAAGLTRWLGSVLRHGPAGLERTSVNEWLARTLPDPAARAAAGALVRVTTYVADHDALSADVAARQIRLDDEVLLADAVVLAAGEPGACARLLGEPALGPLGPAAEVSTLDLGLSSRPRRGRTFGLGIDEATYISKHSPRGHSDGVPISLIGYERGSRAALEAVADVVQPAAGPAAAAGERRAAPRGLAR